MSAHIPTLPLVLAGVGLALKLTRQRDKYREDFAKKMEAENLLRMQLEERRRTLADQKATEKRRLEGQRKKELADARISLIRRGLGVNPASGGGSILRQIDTDADQRDKELEKKYKRQGFADDLRYRQSLLSLSTPSYPDVYGTISGYLE